MKEFRSFPKGEKKPKLTKQQQWSALKLRAMKKMKERNHPLQDKDDVFLRRLWSEQTVHICCNCGQSLGTEYNKIFCNHILLKSEFPQLRYEEANINFYCRSCHRDFHDNPNDIMKKVIAEKRNYFGV